MHAPRIKERQTAVLSVEKVRWNLSVLAHKIPSPICSQNMYYVHLLRFGIAL